MPVTSCIVQFGRNALTIKADATFALTDGTLQPFSNLDDLKTGIITTKPYATMEQDFWLLDGNYHFMPSTDVHVGLMTSTMSNEDGQCAMSVEVTFSAIHSTNGLTLHFSEFSGDWCDDITFWYYDSVNVLIRNDSYNPSSAVFSTNQIVNNFKKIIIDFNGTNKPYRYLRLKQIDFDSLTTFSGSEIKAAQLVESINPIAAELPINTLDFSLFSADGDFSIVDPQGIYANLQYKEPLEAYESVDGEYRYLGRFYLDEWKSRNENLADFKASNAVGLLEKPEYNGGFWHSPFADPYDQILSEDLIDAIMTAANVDYILDASLEGIVFTGHFPVVSCRRALQMVCLAMGAYVSCARSNTLQILPFELASDLTTYDYTLTAADKGQESPVDLLPLVTGVKVLEHNYAIYDPALPPAGGKLVWSGTLAVGTYVIFFDDPIAEVDSDGTAGLVEMSGGPGNFVTVEINSPGTFNIYMVREITHTTQSYSVNNGSLPASTVANVLLIDEVTLINSANSHATTQRIYDYYQQRYKQKTRLYAPAAAVGNSILIDTQSSKQIKGILERMESDLVNGFTANVEIVGVIA